MKFLFVFAMPLLATQCGERLQVGRDHITDAKFRSAMHACSDGRAAEEAAYRACMEKKGYPNLGPLERVR